MQCLTPKLLSCAGIFQEVKSSVFRAAEKIGNVVAVKVDCRRADIVSLDILLGQGASMFESPLTVCLAQTPIEIRICGIQQQIELPISIPIDDAQFAATAGTRRSAGEP